MSSGRFRHESLQDMESISEYLRVLQEGFAQGALSFSTNEKRLIVEPRGLINLEVEAKRKNHEVKLTMRFRWSERPDGEGNGGQTLTIEKLGRG